MFTFSIIIPTYNASKTLRSCLKSIVEQTCQDFEVIVMDGGSTDDTASIVKEFALDNVNINWVSQKDSGIYDAMNKGTIRSVGQWIYFLGSDDQLYDIKVLNDVKASLSNTDASVVYGDAIVLSDLARHGGEFDLEILLHSHNMCHQTVFYKKNVFEKIGYYNLKYPILADWDFNIRCFEYNSLQKIYIERDIVLFNNITGISSISKNDPFYNKIPARYISEMDKIKLELKESKNINKQLLNSRQYTTGNFFYSILKKMGIIKLLSLVRK